MRKIAELADNIILAGVPHHRQLCPGDGREIQGKAHRLSTRGVTIGCYRDVTGRNKIRVAVLSELLRAPAEKKQSSEGSKEDGHQSSKCGQ